MAHHNHSHGNNQLHVHITPINVYMKVFGALIALTLITVFFSKGLHLPGHLGTFVAFAIAITKASLVLMFFMHLKYEKNLNRFVFSLGFIFLMILFAFSFGDMITRAVVTP